MAYAALANDILQETPQPVTGQLESTKGLVERGPAAPARRVNEEVLRSEYESRRSSPSYQAMLVSTPYAC